MERVGLLYVMLLCVGLCGTCRIAVCYVVTCRVVWNVSDCFMLCCYVQGCVERVGLLYVMLLCVGLCGTFRIVVCYVVMCMAVWNVSDYVIRYL